VRRREEGAVRRAEVVQLRLPERGPEDVHVAGGLYRRDVGDDLRVLGRAAVRELLGLGDEPLLFGGGVRRRVDPPDERVQLAVPDTVDGRGPADAAGVEADEV